MQEQMHHPNVVRVLELVTFGLRPYAVMEFVGGMNLRQALLRKDPVVHHPLPIFCQILEGLHHIHSCGFLHLDFKPENILVQPDGHTRIADFDLAQPILPKPRRQPSVQGTPAYLAPEQIMKRPVDPRTDIFALGLTAFELFTRRKPVARSQREEIFAAYCDENTAFPIPSALNRTIPEALDQILGACLAKKPEERYTSVQRIIHDLQESGVLNNPKSITQPDATADWQNLDP